jgi:hypothetical protein
MFIHDIYRNRRYNKKVSFDWLNIILLIINNYLIIFIYLPIISKYL